MVNYFKAYISNAHVIRIAYVVILSIFFISFPCSIEASDGRLIKEWLELDPGFIMSVKNFCGNYTVNHYGFVSEVFSQENESIVKGRSESFGGFVIIFDSFLFDVSALRQVMSCNSTNKCSCEKPERQTSGFDWHTFLYYFGFGCWFLFLGLSVSVITKAVLDKYFPR